MRRSDTRVRRGTAAVVAAAGLSLAAAGPASAAPVEKGEHPFTYGTDVSSWYWERQIDQEVTPPVPLPPPVPPVSQRVRLPSPQRPDTLPVGVFEAQHERMAAIKFDLAERGVTPGSTIEKLVLQIEESADKNEQPSVKPDTAKILDFLGLLPFSGEQVGGLPYGTQKMCDLAMALAADPDVLLLDEPSSGMGPEEAHQLGETLRFLRSSLNLTILMIEHHVPLVVEVCDYVYVLNFGKLLAKGEPAEIQQHPEVVAAYLGGEARGAA